jgi:hypothetical protein
MATYLISTRFDKERRRWIVVNCNVAALDELFYKPFGKDSVGLWLFLVLTTDSPAKAGQLINPRSVLCDALKRRWHLRHFTFTCCDLHFTSVTGRTRPKVAHNPQGVRYA